MSIIHKMLRELDERTKKDEMKSNCQPVFIEKNTSDLSSSRFFNSFKNLQSHYLLFLSMSLLILISAFFLKKEKNHITAPFKHFIHRPVNIIAHNKTAPTTPKETSAGIKTIVSMNPTDQSDFLYQQASDLIQRGNLTPAISALESALKLDPTFKKAREALDVLLIQQGHFTQANNVINDGLMLAPTYIPFLKLKAHLLLQYGRYDDALNLLTLNAVDLEKHPNYYALMAAAYEKDENYMAAAKIYKELTEFEPYNGNWWFGLGVSFQNAHKKDAAAEAFEKALKVGGLDPKARSYLEMQLQAE